MIVDAARGAPRGRGFGWWRPLAIVASAAAHALAFPPWNLTWLAWVSLVPFFLSLRGLTPLRGFAAGWLWGTAAIWVVALWVPPALRFYYQQPWWFVIVFCVVGSQLLWGTYYALFGAAACRILPRTRGVAQVALLSAAWVAAELGRARLLTGEPWMLLGYSLMPSIRMIQAADVGGVYLLSFAVVLVNAALAAVLDAALAARAEESHLSLVSALRRGLGSTWGAASFAAALLLAMALYGHLRLQETLPTAHESRVAVVQGNVPIGAQWRQELFAKGLDEYLTLSEEAARVAKPDLLVWPESAVTFFLAEEPDFLHRIETMLTATGADLIVGGPQLDRSDPSGPHYLNSAFYVTPQGIAGRYDKAHLLPFGEYFPLKTIEFLRRRFERVRSFTSGDGLTLLDTRAGKAAVVICFEAIFPEIVRQQMALGADFLVNLSNDAWLGYGAGPEQHASMVALRAVENRTWIVRATTTGISAIVDPHGRIQAQSTTKTAAVLDAQVAALRIETLYERVGDAFAYACLLAGLSFLALSSRVPARINATIGLSSAE